MQFLLKLQRAIIQKWQTTANSTSIIADLKYILERVKFPYHTDEHQRQYLEVSIFDAVTNLFEDNNNADVVLNIAYEDAHSKNFSLHRPRSAENLAETSARIRQIWYQERDIRNLNETFVDQPVRATP